MFSRWGKSWLLLIKSSDLWFSCCSFTGKQRILLSMCSMSVTTVACCWLEYLIVLQLTLVTTDPTLPPPYKLAKYKLWVRYTTHQGTQYKKKNDSAAECACTMSEISIKFPKASCSSACKLCLGPHIKGSVLSKSSEKREKQKCKLSNTDNVHKNMYTVLRALMQLIICHLIINLF